jgi:hypothetical protein
MTTAEILSKRRKEQSVETGLQPAHLLTLVHEYLLKNNFLKAAKYLGREGKVKKRKGNTGVSLEDVYNSFSSTAGLDTRDGALVDVSNEKDRKVELKKRKRADSLEADLQIAETKR